MEEKILVTYASTNGSTQEIAEVIAETLRSHSLIVDLQPIRKVRTLNGYSAFVLGVPIYMFHWHKDMLRFLSRYQKVLAGGLPVAIFSGGPFSSGDEKEWRVIRSQVDQELAKFPWLTPVAVEVVGGKFDPKQLRFPLNLIPALRQMPASDLRDWAAIRAWADGLPPALLQAGHQTPEKNQ
jgi:menaquinone-dependent protoporphyrinogen oxidase